MGSRDYYNNGRQGSYDLYGENHRNYTESRGHPNFQSAPMPNRHSAIPHASRHEHVESRRHTVTSDDRYANRYMNDPYYQIAEIDNNQKRHSDCYDANYDSRRFNQEPLYSDHYHESSRRDGLSYGNELGQNQVPYNFDSPRRVDEFDYAGRDNGCLRDERRYGLMPMTSRNGLPINHDEQHYDQMLQRPPLEQHDAYAEIEQRSYVDEKLRTQRESQHDSSEAKPPMIEIEPGWFAPLRGAAETFDAAKRDFFVPTECICCNSTVFCIQDADFILCPTCRVVSQISIENGGGSEKNGGKGGVGLGFTLDDLASWQQDIQRERDDAIKIRQNQEKRRLFQKQEQELSELKRRAYNGGNCNYDERAVTNNHPDFFRSY